MSGHVDDNELPELSDEGMLSVVLVAEAQLISPRRRIIAQHCRHSRRPPRPTLQGLISGL